MSGEVWTRENAYKMTDTIDIEVRKIGQSKIDKVDFDNIQFGKVYADHMFMADYSNGKWGNFKITPYEHLSLSPANSALHYGQSVFEGMKAYRNVNGEAVLFRPDANLKRLNRSADRMCIPQVPENIFMDGLRALVKLDEKWIPNKPNTALYIRPYIFATDEYIGIRPSDSYKFIIFCCPVGAYYAAPVKVKIETRYSRAFPGGIGFAKAAGNYASSLYPAKMASEAGFQQLLWTDGLTHQYIEESGTMNVMFIINDTLITAPAGETILNGITRDSVLTLARDWGLKVEERKVAVTEVIDAIKDGTLKEAFGTGTAATIAHIAVIGYEGEEFTLPSIEGRTFSNKVLKALEEIKTGAAPDKFNWLQKV